MLPIIIITIAYLKEYFICKGIKFKEQQKQPKNHTYVTHNTVEFKVQFKVGQNHFSKIKTSPCNRKKDFHRQRLS